MKKSSAIRIAAIVAAATVGDGVFALPYVFKESGWLLGLAYLAVLGVVVIAAHVVYLRTLEEVGSSKRLLGLTKEYLGPWGFWLGFFAIVIGLLLTLVAYLILGSQFIRLAAPSVPPFPALLLFWFAVSVPVFLDDRKIIDLELLGIACTSLVILFIFLTAFPRITFDGAPLVNPSNLFLPFGAILFSLAGWTGIEPAFEARRRSRNISNPWRGVALGTIFAAVLKIMFVTGILGSAPLITVDTISGLFSWPVWKREVVSVLGLLAVWTIFLPISREVKNALQRDLGWGKDATSFLIVGLPLVLVASGFNNFLIVVEVVGGLFLTMQYFLIIAVGRRALKFPRASGIALDLIAAVFVVGAIYQVITFIVR